MWEGYELGEDSFMISSLVFRSSYYQQNLTHSPLPLSLFIPVFLVHSSPDIYFLDSSYDPVIKHGFLPYPVLVVY